MSSVEELIRAATRAEAERLRAVRPLRLPPAPDALPGPRPGVRARRARRFGAWIAPVTAAAAVLAVALSLVLVRDIPNGRVVPAHSPTAPVPGGTAVPEYYAALTQGTVGQILVRNTFTGAAVATVRPPRSVTFISVTGAADDRTFVLGAQYSPPTTLPVESWYLLRIAPGTADPVRLTRLPIGPTLSLSSATGIALSPDGSRLALVTRQYPAPSNGNPQLLRLYSVPAGALLRTWSTDAGVISAGRAPAAPGVISEPNPNNSLSWVSGQRLAFVLRPGDGQASGDYGSIRLLDTAAAGGDLITASTQLRSLAPTFTLGFAPYACHPELGWAALEDGKTVLCAAVGGVLNDLPTASDDRLGCRPKPPLRLGFVRWPPAGTAKKIPQPGGGYASEIIGTEGQVYAAVTPCLSPADSVYLGWASPSGDVLIGAVRYPGHDMFGVISGGRLTPLPRPPAGIPLTAIAW